MATGREQQMGWGWGVGGSLVTPSEYISFREQEVGVLLLWKTLHGNTVTQKSSKAER